MKRRGAPNDRRTGGPTSSWRAGSLLALVVLSACGAGVNEDLIATSTPYPLQSPVAVGSVPGPNMGTPVTSYVSTGQAALASDDPVAAERAFDRALVGDPDEPVALLGRAEARLRRGDLAGAREDVKTLSRATLTDAATLAARGELRLRFGDHTGAESDFSAALARDPGYVAAFTGRARAILASAEGADQRYEAALADFRRALTLDPASPEGRLGPAMVFVDRARFDGDPEDWRRAEAELAGMAEPTGEADPRWAALSARVQAALGAAEEAAATVASGLARSPVGPDLALLRAVEAELALARSDWSAAESAARAGIAADPLAWDARYALVAALLGAGHADDAVLVAQELLDLVPGDGRGLYLMGLALDARGNAAGARQALTAAASALPDSAVYQARVTLALDRGAASQAANPPSTPTPWVRLRELDRETPAARLMRSH